MPLGSFTFFESEALLFEDFAFGSGRQSWQAESQVIVLMEKHPPGRAANRSKTF